MGNRWAWLLTIVVSVAAMFSAERVNAQEQRCNELGANCVCAVSFGGTGWTASGSSSGFRESPAHDTSKLCNSSNGSNLIYSSGGALSQISGCLGGRNCLRDRMTGGTTVVEPSGSIINSLTGRVAARYYIRLSSDYQTTHEGSCTNDKYIQLGDYLTAQNNGFYSSNGGGFPNQIGPRDVRGKWIRIEMVVDRYSSPSQMTFYLKNVTDDTPEVSFTVPTRLANSATDRANATHPLHKYRAGNCNGYADMMFMVLAHWPSPRGNERIGPAAELEGGAGVPPPSAPPAAPSGLSVLQ